MAKPNLNLVPSNETGIFYIEDEDGNKTHRVAVDIEPIIVDLNAGKKIPEVKKRREKRSRKAIAYFRVGSQENREKGNAGEGKTIANLMTPFFVDLEYGTIYDPFGIIQNGLLECQTMKGVSSDDTLIVFRKPENGKAATNTFVGVRKLHKQYHSNGEGREYLFHTCFHRQLYGIKVGDKADYQVLVQEEGLVILRLIKR